MTRIGIVDVLVIDFDPAFTVPAIRALQAVGATCRPVLAEESTAEDWINARGVLLAASSLDTDHRSLKWSTMACERPVLGICNGAQVMARDAGALIAKLPQTEKGWMTYYPSSGGRGILENILRFKAVYMEHDFEVCKPLPTGFKTLGSTDQTAVASFEFSCRGIPRFGVQFHPELDGSRRGVAFMSKFVRLSRRLARSQQALSGAGRIL